ncbi:Gfo/Idh/MocA family protein [Jannaschia sp. 2305UL9-9]|uniref:Gfo/Idh/MocA family protein n=1 Tax=Jannaschia sp. 2305UL9-9 TaxID=3121638 RepID=UPI0035297AEA
MKNVALIGLGMVSDTIADAIQRSDKVNLAAGFARSEQSRSDFMDRFPGVPTVESLDAVADDPEIDFVVLATPPSARAAPIERLIAAGKPILMEKPIERTLAAATEIVEACEAAKIPLGVIFQHRTREPVANLRARLPDLGQIHAVEVHIPWWRPQSYYDEPGRGTYAKDGGGVMLTQAIHIMDLMLSLTGPVVEVTAMAATTGQHRMEAEDFVSAGLRYANGAVGSLMASTASFPGRGEMIVLHCTNGSAKLERGQLSIDWQNGESETIGLATASGGGADPMAFTSDWHRAIIDDFAAALDAGRPPMITGREGLEVHRLIDALETSAKTGTRMDVGA